MTLHKLFGTDGIRAHISSPLLTPENIAQLGRILGIQVKEGACGTTGLKRPKVAIGHDTRESGRYIEHALVAGICASGVDCSLLGVMPTAAVAGITRETASSLGIMISASHNPYYDNGLKLFDAAGFKINSVLEEEIEHRILNFKGRDYPIDLSPGRITNLKDAANSYYASLLSAFIDEHRASGPKIVVDCALGAASRLAKEIFTEFGCQVLVIGEYNDGDKINFGYGSEAPETIRSAVLENHADLGIAFDGDADRVIFIDENGHVIDGDAILALMAIDLKSEGRLEKNTFTATIMSSIALDRVLTPHGIKVVRTSVGDKLVAEKMREEGFSFGGENSGHLIMFPYSTTGDGILSALKFLSILKRARVSASKLVDFFRPTPKLLRNIAIHQKISLSKLPKTLKAIEQINEDLKSCGRVLLRYSGTENKARLLVEALTNTDCERIADHIGNAFSAEIKEVACQQIHWPRHKEICGHSKE